MNDIATIEFGVLPTGKTALDVFTSPDAIDPLLGSIREVIDAFKPDTSTAKGRKAIASMAYRVAQAKTRLDDEGKKLADQQKEIPKQIDKTRKRLRDTLDKWKDEVRAPLTEWEEREEKRISDHKAAVAWLQSYRDLPFSTASADLKERLAEVEDIAVGSACEEFVADYAAAKDEAIKALRERIHARTQVEVAEEEARRTREAEEARAAKERDLRLQEEAASAARREVEERAQRERDEASRREEALRAEADAARRRAVEAEAAAARRQEDETKRAADEAARRAADIELRRRVNRSACEALVVGGLPEDMAKLCITLIASGRVPQVTINY